MLASDISLVPVKGQDKDKIDIAEHCNKLLGEHRSSDPYEFSGAVVNTVTGRCLALDMRAPEDREKYADLTAACRSMDGSVELVWEEHVTTADGGLFVYVCFIENCKLSSNLIDR